MTVRFKTRMVLLPINLDETTIRVPSSSRDHTSTRQSRSVTCSSLHISSSARGRFKIDKAIWWYSSILRCIISIYRTALLFLSKVRSTLNIQWEHDYLTNLTIHAHRYERWSDVTQTKWTIWDMSSRRRQKTLRSAVELNQLVPLVVGHMMRQRKNDKEWCEIGESVREPLDLWTQNHPRRTFWSRQESCRTRSSRHLILQRM